MRRRRFWGWGFEDAGHDEEQQQQLGQLLGARLGIAPPQRLVPPRIEDISLRAPRFEPPKDLAPFFSADPGERAGHSYGKAFRDVVRGLRRSFDNPPDWVAFPTQEQDIVATLDWCGSHRVAVIPYGGGSSVVGDFGAAVDAVRAISQTGLFPSNCRLHDAGEALTSGAGSGREHLLLLAFESADHPLDAWMARALECCRDHGGVIPTGAGRTVVDERVARDDSAGAWRQSFLGAPYLRDALVCMGMISETFETAITWDRFETFHAAVTTAVEEALRRVCGGGTVTCRLTHVYPDGPAPYYTVIAPSRPDSQLEQWDEIKQAAAEAISVGGGTITHHHAVGRDHRPWYDRERPELFAQALGAAKDIFDPSSIMNPNVLVDRRATI